MPRYVSYLCVLIFFPSLLHAQCMLENMSLIERNTFSTEIFDGIVTSQNTIFNEADGHIYTIYEIDEKESERSILFSIRGGRVNDLIEIVTPSLKLNIGDQGLFFLKEWNTNKRGEIIYEGAVGLLSFLKYNEKQDNYSDGLNVYNKNEIISSLDGLNIKTLSSSKEETSPSLLVPPVILGISPTVVTAGTEEIITITGNNFGSSATGFALLELRNPDITGSLIAYEAVNPEHILSWTNTQIQVIVPGRDPFLGKAGAGSGKVRVRNPEGETTTSAMTITVRYNRFTDGIDGMLLIDDNGFGGYTLSYNEAFFVNTPAVDAFERALETWQCTIETSVVTDGSTTTSSCPANDGVNIVSFDGNCQLPTNLHAQTTHWFIACPSGEAIFLEMDLIFDGEANWNYGTGFPSSGQFDFESLALHELGHSHGIGHVRDENSIMYPLLQTGIVKRDIDSDSEECGDAIVLESSILSDCGGNDPFIPLPACNLPCELMLSAVQTSDCLPSGMVDYTLTVIDINGGSSGFNVLVDGVLTPESPYDYEVFGTTIVSLSIIGDGESHMIEIQDVNSLDCLDSVDVTPPDCFCSLDMVLSQVGNCDINNELPYSLNVLDNNGGTSGFNVFINSVLLTGSPFDYDSSGSTFLDINLPGDGLEQTIEIIDVDDVLCTISDSVVTENCICDLSFEVTPSEDCLANDSLLYTLTITSVNGSDIGFNVIVDGVGDVNNPYAYDASGTTVLTILLPGDASDHTISVVDAVDNLCEDNTTVTTIDCTCELGFTAVQTTGCDLTDSVTVSLTITSLNVGTSGFDVLVDGVILGTGPFTYGASGTTILDITVLGDGTAHLIEVVDVEDDECMSSTMITTEDCICDLSFEVTPSENCLTNDSLLYTLTITSVNGSGVGFNVMIDGVGDVNNPYAYDASGTTVLTILLPGDASDHTISVVDALDNLCEDNTTVTTIDCTCELDFTAVQTTGCDLTDSVTVSLTITSLNVGTSGFDVLVDGVILGTGPFTYGASGTTILDITVLGDGTAHLIEVVDVEDDECMSSTMITTEDCICDLSFEVTPSENCLTNDSLLYTLTITSENGSGVGFNVIVDGVGDVNNPYAYDVSGTTVLTILLPGDASDHTISVVDALDNLCEDNTTVTTIDCTCELDFTAVQTTGCDLTDSVTVSLTITSLNVGTSGFDVLVDGVILGTGPFTYGASGTTILDITVLGDGTAHLIEVVDVEDDECMSSTMITTEDCICDLSFEVTPSENCLTNDSLLYTLTITSVNGSGVGFNVMIDGVGDVNNPYAYDASGTTVLTILLPGDASDHTISVVDALDNLCEDNTTVTTIDCTCELDFTAVQTTGCDLTDSVTVSLTITSLNVGTSGFDVLVDGVILGAGPFTYGASGTTILDITVFGDGAAHLIEVVDVEDDECMSSTMITTEDCICDISFTAVAVGGCTATDSILYTLTITSENGSDVGFNVIVDGVGDVNNPYTYDASGTTVLTISLPGDASDHTISVVDAVDNLCEDNTTVTTIDCTCELNFTAVQTTGCDLMDSVAVSLTITAINFGASGFNVLVDGQVLTSGPYDYDGSGTTLLDINILGDGAEHIVEIIDVEDNACTVSQIITTENCICDLNITASQTSTCDDDEIINYQISVISENPSLDGFNIIVDGAIIMGSPFMYDVSGTTILNIQLNGDGQNHSIEVQDLNDLDCSSIINVSAPDCTCSLDLTAIQNGDCENGDVEYILTITDTYGSPEGFNVYIDGGLVGGSPFMYDMSGTTSLSLPITGDNTNHEIEIVDASTNCMVATTVLTPDCTCSVSLSASQSADCDASGVSTWTLTIEDENGSTEGFNLYVNGNLAAGSPFVYSALGTTLVDLSIPGDGGLYEISLLDVGVPDCAAIVEISAPDCTCSLDLTAIQNGDCENGDVEYVLTITDTYGSLEGFNLYVDGSLTSGSPFMYDVSGTTSLSLSITGDNTNHEIEIVDASTNCMSSTIVLTPDCTCLVNLSASQSIECDASGVSIWTLTIEDENGSAEGFDLYVNGNLVAGSPFVYSALGTTLVDLSIPGDGGGYEVSLFDIGMPACTALIEIMAPDCTCSLDLTAVQSGDCENGDAEYVLTITDTYGSPEGFNVYIDGGLVGGSPFMYDMSGTTSLSLPITGDNTNHEIEIVDASTNCMATTIVLTPDCTCSVSLSASQSTDCDASGISIWTLTIEEENGSTVGFDLYVNGNLVAGSPFVYSALGTTLVDLPILGDGGIYEISLLDVGMPDCAAIVEIMAPNCTCSLDLTAIQNGDCENGDVEYVLTITENFGSPDGFNLYLDGTLISGSPFMYDMSGTTSMSLSITGDNTNHEIEIVDADGTTCTATTIVLPPDCTCSVSLSASQSTDCDDLGISIWTVTINEMNGSPNGFNLYINGNLVTGSPFLYSELGTTLVDIPIPGDGLDYEISLVDVDMATCIALTEITAPDCTCELMLSANQNGDCENGEVVYNLVITDTYGSLDGFNVFLDGNLVSGSPFMYNVSGTTTLNLSVIGDNTNHEIEIVDASGECTAETIILTPDCHCELMGTASLISACNEDQLTTWSLAITAQNPGIDGFDIFIDNELANPLGYIYTGTITFVEIELPGDGNDHEIIIQDKADNNCFVTITVTSLDCHCNLIAETISASPCNEDGEVLILGSLVHELVFSSGFRVYVNGVEAIESPFLYETDNFSNFEILLPGDGNTHLIEIQDEDDDTCITSTSITVPDCSTTVSNCELTISGILIDDCEDDAFGFDIQFTGPQDPQAEYNILLNNEIYEGSPFNYHSSGSNIIHLEAECDTIDLQIVDLQVDACQIDTTIIPSFAPGRFVIYPNPIFTELSDLIIEGIDVEDHDRLLRVNLYDVLGKNLFETRLTGKPKMTLDMRELNLSAAVYYITIGSNAKYHAKLVVLTR